MNDCCREAVAQAVKDRDDLLAAFALIRRTTLPPQDVSGWAMYSEAVATHNRIAAAIRSDSFQSIRSVGVDSSECMPGCQTVGPHDMCTKWMSGGPLGEKA